jgi:hypothetical protein
MEKIKQALMAVFEWILVSSADPNEVSLTVKGALVAIIPGVMALAGLAHVNLGDGSVLTGLFDAVAQFVQSLLTVVATVMTVVGAVRKVYFLLVPPNSTSAF